MVGLGTLAGGAVVYITLKAVDNYSKTFARAGAALTAFGVAGAMAIKSVLKLTGTLEQQKIAFTTMLGSEEKAIKLLDELTAFAKKTPFTIPGIRDSTKQLLAMGIDSKKLLPTLKSLGDVAAGLSIPLNRLAYNFGQVKAQGRLTGVELRDFARAGVPLIAELAKMYGVTEGAIKEMVSAGVVGFDDVEKAFSNMTGEGGKFFNLMDKQSESLFGVISNIQDSFIQLGEVMGEVLLPPAKWVAEKLAVIVGWMEQHPKVAQFAIVVTAVATALALIIGPILILIALLPLLIAGMTALSTVSLPITGTILLIAAAVLAIIAAFIWWKEILVGWTKFLLKTVNFITGVWEGFRDFWKVMWAQAANIIYSIWNKITDYLANKVNFIIKILNGLIWAYNKIAGVLGLGTIDKIADVTFNNLKAKLIDIGALEDSLAKQREADSMKRAKESAEKIQALKDELGLVKEVEKVSPETSGESAEQSLVSRLSKFKLLSSGDIYNPGAFQTSGKGKPFGEFQTSAAVDQARRGGGVTINIENVNGLDPEEISRALGEELNDKLSL